MLNFPHRAWLSLSKHPRLRADILLFGTAIIWGWAFAAQRFAAAYLDIFIFTGIRFLLGALTVFLIGRKRMPGLTRFELKGGIVLGMVVLAAAALQQAGLRFTTAGKAAFITGLYVILVPIFLAWFWSRSPHRPVWAGSILAVIGLFLLSVNEQFHLAPGDGFELAGAFLWGGQIILIGYLMRKADALRLAFVQFISCGLVSLLIGLSLETPTLSGFYTAWWAVLFNGIFSVGIAFTLQMIGQKTAPETDSAIILSLEAVFATIFGWLILGELLTLRQMAGCGLMLSAMLIAQLKGSQNVLLTDHTEMVSVNGKSDRHGEQLRPAE